jgi:hypothetical protein
MRSIMFKWSTSSNEGPCVIDAIAATLREHGPLCAERDALRARAEAAERDAEAWRGFAIDVAREVAPVDAEDSAHQTSVDDLPALLRMVRGAGEQHAIAIARAEAAEAALATARAEGAAAERAAIAATLTTRAAVLRERKALGAAEEVEALAFYVTQRGGGDA